MSKELDNAIMLVAACRKTYPSKCAEYSSKVTRLQIQELLDKKRSLQSSEVQNDRHVTGLELTDIQKEVLENAVEGMRSQTGDVKHLPQKAANVLTKLGHLQQAAHQLKRERELSFVKKLQS